jgi:hypothetical protein
VSRSVSVADMQPQEAAFLAAYFELGASPQWGAEAARRAGYGDTPEEAERAAAFLLASTRITRAIKNEIAQRFTIASGAALAALLDVCENGQSESARIAAANAILDRGVGPVMSKSAVMTAQITVEDWLNKLDVIEVGQSHPDGRE